MSVTFPGSSRLQKGDTVLVKASHFMGFEDVVKELEKNKIDW